MHHNCTYTSPDSRQAASIDTVQVLGNEIIRLEGNKHATISQPVFQFNPNHPTFRRCSASVCFVFSFICFRVCVRACVRACLRACVHACVRACMPACVHMHVRVFIDMHLPTCITTCPIIFTLSRWQMQWSVPLLPYSNPDHDQALGCTGAGPPVKPWAIHWRNPSWQRTVWSPVERDALPARLHLCHTGHQWRSTGQVSQ